MDFFYYICGMNIDPTLLKDLRAGVVNPAELERWLLTNVPVPQLVHELAELLIQEQVSKPIILTKEQFNAHFRVQGYRVVDGKLVEEARGNYSKK